jgi:hypothetical protein
MGLQPRSTRHHVAARCFRRPPCPSRARPVIGARLTVRNTATRRAKAAVRQREQGPGGLRRGQGMTGLFLPAHKTPQRWPGTRNSGRRSPGDFRGGGPPGLLDPIRQKFTPYRGPGDTPMCVNLVGAVGEWRRRERAERMLYSPTPMIRTPQADVPTGLRRVSASRRPPVHHEVDRRPPTRARGNSRRPRPLPPATS